MANKVKKVTTYYLTVVFSEWEVYLPKLKKFPPNTRTYDIKPFFTDPSEAETANAHEPDSSNILRHAFPVPS
jgi:hypothetical protein